MADPVRDIIGDYRAFVAQQRDRLRIRGIDIAGYEFSHLAFRVPEWDQYLHVRSLLERHSTANVEGVWNGRPMSMLLLTDALRVLDGQEISLIELIPPIHQRVYKMGMEHFGVVVGEGRGLLSPASRSADRAAVPEPMERAVLHPLRGLHAREVPPASAEKGDRTAGRPVRRHPSCRRLGAPAIGHRHRTESAAAVAESSHAGLQRSSHVACRSSTSRAASRAAAVFIVVAGDHWDP